MKVSVGDKEPKKDIEVAEDEINEDKTPADDSGLAESGKKDPFVRRQELLIKSGLAEVGCLLALAFLLINYPSVIFCSWFNCFD